MAVGEVLNLDCFIGTDQRKIRETLAQAEGRQINRSKDRHDVDGRIRYDIPPNGGIVNPKREHLKVGQYYIRFFSKSLPYKSKVGGGWWNDFDTVNNMYQRYLATGPNENVRYEGQKRDCSARSTLREWMALTFEWNEIEEFVVAQLWARMDAYTGAGRTAEGSGSHQGDKRAFGYAPHLANHFTIKQLFIPELWKHHEQAFPKPAFFNLNQLDKFVAGELGHKLA